MCGALLTEGYVPPFPGFLGDVRRRRAACQAFNVEGRTNPECKNPNPRIQNAECQNARLAGHFDIRHLVLRKPAYATLVAALVRTASAARTSCAAGPACPSCRRRRRTSLA